MKLKKVLDILGFIGGVSGALLVTFLNKWGFICFIVGSGGHGYLGFIQKNYGLAAMAVIFIIIDIFAFAKWSGWL